MIRSFNLLLPFVLTVLITSCGGDSFNLPANIYTIDRVYDINNNNNSSDIRVEVQVSSVVTTADLVEVRLVIVKAGKLFTEDQISSLSAGNYFSFPVASTEIQVIKPSSTILDADGDVVANNIPYKVYIAVIGKKDAKQLSAAADLTLADRPIYEGDYVGTWKDIVNDPNILPFKVSLRVKDDYTGQLFYTEKFEPFAKGLEDATITFTIDGASITSFEINQFMRGYSGGPQAVNPTTDCPAFKKVTGRIDDDVNLILNKFNWADCDMTRDVELNFKKL